MDPAIRSWPVTFLGVPSGGVAAGGLGTGETDADGSGAVVGIGVVKASPGVGDALGVADAATGVGTAAKFVAAGPGAGTTMCSADAGDGSGGVGAGFGGMETGCVGVATGFVGVAIGFVGAAIGFVGAGAATTCDGDDGRVAEGDGLALAAGFFRGAGEPWAGRE